MSRRAAGKVLDTYSTSFGLATRLLPRAMREDIRALYAVVRVADEIVDSRLPRADAKRLLADYRDRVLTAPRTLVHTDPILQAYGATARTLGFPAEHLEAFFDSMRQDIGARSFTRTELDAYIYGSAEVIGELCLIAFLGGKRPQPAVAAGARRLGAGFQKVNFLRDLRFDRRELGRDYLPLVTSDAAKRDFTGEIDRDFAVAQIQIPALPPRAGLAVSAALGLYQELNRKLDRASYAEVSAGRIRLTASERALVLSRAGWRLATRHGKARDPQRREGRA